MSFGGSPAPEPIDSAAGDVDALVVDRYLDSLLSAEHADDIPPDPRLDPVVGRAIRRLRRDLGRVHPSFRFEERLAARLADEAARMHLRAAAGGEGVVIPLVASPDVMDAAQPRDDEIDGLAVAAPRPSRPGPLPAFRTALPDPSTMIASLPRQLIIGGALTSAAISLAGAYVVLRGRQPRAGASPMARAVRAAHGARAASATIGAGAVSVLRPAARAISANASDRARSRLD